MNPYALPSFIACALLLVLGLTVILQNPRDKISRLLCLLCLNLGLAMSAVGMLHLSTNEAEANFWNKWPYIISILSYAFMMAYAFQISGGPQRPKDKMLGLSMDRHRWIIYSIILIWCIIIIFSDLVIAPAKYYATTGWEHQPFKGSTFYWFNQL